MSNKFVQILDITFREGLLQNSENSLTIKNMQYFIIFQRSIQILSLQLFSKVTYFFKKYNL